MQAKITMFNESTHCPNNKNILKSHLYTFKGGGELQTLRTGSLKYFEHHATYSVSIMGFLGSRMSSPSSPSSRIYNIKQSINIM